MNKYSSYILYLLISILVAILAVNHFGPLDSLQRSINDALCDLTAEDGLRNDVVLVRLDGRAQEAFGQLPWNHDLIADLTAAVASGEPKAIMVDVELSEDAAQDSAGYTEVLAEQMRYIPQTVLRYDIALANFRSNKTSHPDELFQNSITTSNPLGLMSENASLLGRKVFLPASRLLQHKPYLGFHYHRPDDDRLLRHQPLLLNYEGFYYPSASLLAAAVYLGVSTDQIQAVEGEEIQLGTARRIPIDDNGDFFINYSRGVPFLQYSAADVLTEGFKFNMFKDKVVLIGPGDLDAVEAFATPVEHQTSSLVVKATVVENIINDNMIEVRDDLATVSLLVVLALGGLCAFVLPRVSLMYRMIILVGALILLANASYLLLTGYHMMVETVYVAFLLVLFMGASPMLDSELITGKKAAGKARADEAKAARQAARERKHAEPEEVPVRELADSGSDAINIKTSAVGPGDVKSGSPMSDSSSIDHQTISLNDEPTTPAGGQPANRR